MQNLHCFAITWPCTSRGLRRLRRDDIARAILCSRNTRATLTVPAAFTPLWFPSQAVAEDTSLFKELTYVWQFIPGPSKKGPTTYVNVEVR